MGAAAGAIASVAGPVVGGIVGNSMSQGDRNAAMDAYNKAYSIYADMPIPDIEKQKLALQHPEVQGILQPYMEQAQQQAPSEMGNIAVDPKLQQAQMQALDTLSKMGATGLTAQDKMALNETRRQISGDEQSRQAQILQNMAQRGAGGSGMELAARLASSQAAADKGSQQTDQLLAMAQNRMLNAVSQAGSLGGQMQNQQFGEQADIARAKDLINQFNTQQAASTQQRNTSSLNSAQAANLGEKQRIADTGVNIANQQEQANKGLLQQEFTNKMARATGQTGALQNIANQDIANANRTAQMWQSIGSGVGQGASAMSSPSTPGKTPPAGA